MIVTGGLLPLMCGLGERIVLGCTTLVDPNYQVDYLNQHLLEDGHGSYVGSFEASVRV